MSYLYSIIKTNKIMKLSIWQITDNQGQVLNDLFHTEYFLDIIDVTQRIHNTFGESVTFIYVGDLTL